MKCGVSLCPFSKESIMNAALKVFAASAVIAVGLGHAASAAPITFVANLNGPSESPPQNSNGTGFAQVVIDTVTNTMRVDVTFSGLNAGTTASHIHCCTTIPFSGTAGVATTTPTFPNFPLGVTSGSYDQTFDMTLASSYNPAFITAQGSISAAETALFNGMMSGNDYLNIHTTFAPGGEIRGFLRPVPEPLSATLLGLGLVGAAFMRRRKVS
jgi:hypothetical protein